MKAFEKYIFKFSPEKSIISNTRKKKHSTRDVVSHHKRRVSFFTLKMESLPSAHMQAGGSCIYKKILSLIFKNL